MTAGQVQICTWRPEHAEKLASLVCVSNQLKVGRNSGIVGSEGAGISWAWGKTTFGGLESVGYLSEVRMAAKYAVERAPNIFFQYRTFTPDTTTKNLANATTVCTGDTFRYTLGNRLITLSAKKLPQNLLAC